MKHDFLQPLAGVAASAVALANLDTVVTFLAVIVGVVNTAVLLARVFIRIYSIIKKHIRGELTAEQVDTELQKINKNLSEVQTNERSYQSHVGEFSDQDDN